MGSHHLVPRVRGLLLSPRATLFLFLVACSTEVPCPYEGGCNPSGDLGARADVRPLDAEDGEATPDVGEVTDEELPAPLTDVADGVEPPDLTAPGDDNTTPDGEASDAGLDTEGPDTATDADASADDIHNNDVGEPFDPCDDNNPCTIDTEVDGVCFNTYEYGVCCTANTMCADDDPCTEDVCAQGLCTHKASCCATDADCPNPDPLCSAARCVNGACLSTATLAPSCCAPTTFEALFDDGTAGGILIENTYLDVGWHVSDAFNATTPPGSLRYARIGGPDYDNGVEHRGRATLPLRVLPPGVQSWLRFDVLLDVEPGGAYDLFRVDLVDLGPAAVASPPSPTAGALDEAPIDTIWDKSKATLYFDWQSVEVDLSAYAGHAILIRFAFDTVDNQANDQSGVFLDGVRLVSDCTARECSLDTECSDGTPYTDDRCLVPPGESVGGCAYIQSSEYCAISSECDDGLPCTINTCSGNHCVFTPSPSCCLSDKSCDDGNPCTADDCVGLGGPNGGTCINVMLQGCCYSVAQCDDGNPCTVDACPVSGQQCAHTVIPGCCSKNEQCDDQDPCTTDLCGGGSCVHEVACCASDAGCDDGDDLCTTDRCVKGQCTHALTPAPSCCLSTLFNADFTSGSTSGFSGIYDSNNSDGVAWIPVTNDGSQSPNGAYHFGRYGGTYATGERVRGITESPPFFVPASSAVSLSFWLRLENEWSMGQGNIAWDRFDISVRLPDDTAVVVWSSADGEPTWWLGAFDKPEGAAWFPVSGIDLAAFRGLTVRLRFEFDSIDDEANDYGGLWVDDVLVMASCPP